LLTLFGAFVLSAEVLLHHSNTKSKGTYLCFEGANLGLRKWSANSEKDITMPCIIAIDGAMQKAAWESFTQNYL